MNSSTSFNLDIPSVGVVDVSRNREELIKKAEKMHFKAQSLLHRQKKHCCNNSYLPNWLKWDEISLTFYTSAKYFYLCDRWHDCANCYDKAARIQEEMKHFQQAAFMYCEAGNAISKANASDCDIYYNKALSIYCTNRTYQKAGRIERKLAIIHEKEKNYVLAIDYYKKASNHFQVECMHLESNGCLLKLVNLMGSITTPERYYLDAANIFLDLGRYAKKENLLKFNARDYLFRSGLLLLALNDLTLLKDSFLPSFYECDFLFKNSREHDFLLNIASAMKLENIHHFVDHVFFYHVASGLDNWCLTLLKRVKNLIER